MSKILTTAVMLALTSFPVSEALAREPIPEESGFSGHINLGLGGFKVKNNMAAGNSFSDISKERITSLTSSPDSEEFAVPMINGEIIYTFAESRTQIFIGNRVEDLLRYDFNAGAGVRQEIGKFGNIALSYIFTPITGEVWADPYVVNQNRVETDIDANGVRFEWEKVLSSELYLQYTYRELDVDDEQSGSFLGLSLADRESLRRDSDYHNFQVGYTIKLNENHFLIPSGRYVKNDAEGSAMEFDRYIARLTHQYRGERFNFITDIEFGVQDYDGTNPIYGKTQDDDILGAFFTAIYKNPWGLTNWGLLGRVGYFESDSNINFYDSEITVISLSALYRF